MTPRCIRAAPDGHGYGSEGGGRLDAERAGAAARPRPRRADPPRHQLQDGLRDAIRSGRLRRRAAAVLAALAEQLGVSRGLVVDSYAQLEAEGYLPSPGLGDAGRVGGAGRRRDRAGGARPRLEIDFEYGVPDLASFPMRDWAWAFGVAGRTATVDDLGDEHGAGGDAPPRR